MAGIPEKLKRDWMTADEACRELAISDADAIAATSQRRSDDPRIQPACAGVPSVGRTLLEAWLTERRPTRNGITTDRQPATDAAGRAFLTEGNGMLTLRRKPGQRVVLTTADGTKIEVVNFGKSPTSFGITAGADVNILRGEVADRDRLATAAESKS